MSFKFTIWTKKFSVVTKTSQYTVGKNLTSNRKSPRYELVLNTSRMQIHMVICEKVGY